MLTSCSRLDVEVIDPPLSRTMSTRVCLVITGSTPFRYTRFNCSVSYSLHVQLGGRVTEIPSVSPRPLSGIHIPLSGAPVSAHGQAACHPIARVCVPLDAAVTRVTCTCPARRGPARRGCHSCDSSSNITTSQYSVLSYHLPLERKRSDNFIFGGGRGERER